MSLGKKLIVTSLLFVLIIAFQSIALARSVYVVSDTGTYAGDDSFIRSYEIDGNSLIYQQNEYKTVTQHAIGLAIDPCSEYIFVTCEDTPKIELINTKTMQYIDTIIAPGATNLAGIVMDTGKKKLYAVDRYTNHLYSWSWDPAKQILSPDFDDPYYIELEDISNEVDEGAFGIALDEVHHRLYVADNTNMIKYYDTNDPNWSKIGQITASCNVVSIAIDVNNQLLYYGSMGTYGQGDPHLYQYAILSQTEDYNDVGCSVAGIAVDQETSLVYITTYGDSGDTYYPNPPNDRLLIYNSNLEKQQWESGDIGNPAGVAVAAGVSYKDPFDYLDLEKSDDATGCVSPYDKIIYTINYEANGDSDSNVVITDYLPVEVDPIISIFDSNYNEELHRYTWKIEPFLAEGSVMLEVIVNEFAEPLGTITNYCEIEGDQYCSFTTSVTNTCWWVDVIYVDKSAVGGLNTGTSWQNAYLDLQDAIRQAWAGRGSQIRVVKNYENKSDFI